jgi:YebC/PmpR family DNA-binding regulatory protein
MAVKSGGPDPAMNPKLRLLIQNARSENMPKENVERAIKRAVSKDSTDYKEVVYEGYGPHGIAVVVETATDNPTRTVGNVRSYFTRNGGSLGTMGMLDFLFERKCSFKVAMKEGIEIEDLELEMIDYGVEEIFVDEGEIHIYSEFTSFGPIQKYLEENHFEILSFAFERIPNDTKALTPEQQADFDKMLERMDDDEDITNVFHNIK